MLGNFIKLYDFQRELYYDSSNNIDKFLNDHPINRPIYKWLLDEVVRSHYNDDEDDDRNDLSKIFGEVNICNVFNNVYVSMIRIMHDPHPEYNAVIKFPRLFKGREVQNNYEALIVYAYLKIICRQNEESHLQYLLSCLSTRISDDRLLEYYSGFNMVLICMESEWDKKLPKFEPTPSPPNPKKIWNFEWNRITNGYNIDCIDNAIELYTTYEEQQEALDAIKESYLRRDELPF